MDEVCAVACRPKGWYSSIRVKLSCLELFGGVRSSVWALEAITGGIILCYRQLLLIVISIGLL